MLVILYKNLTNAEKGHRNKTLEIEISEKLKKYL